MFGLIRAEECNSNERHNQERQCSLDIASRLTRRDLFFANRLCLDA
jgi:hypothetical protein